MVTPLSKLINVSVEFLTSGSNFWMSEKKKDAALVLM